MKHRFSRTLLAAVCCWLAPAAYASESVLTFTGTLLASGCALSSDPGALPLDGAEQPLALSDCDQAQGEVRFDGATVDDAHAWFSAIGPGSVIELRNHGQLVKAHQALPFSAQQPLQLTVRLRHGARQSEALDPNSLLSATLWFY